MQVMQRVVIAGLVTLLTVRKLMKACQHANHSSYQAAHMVMFFHISSANTSYRGVIIQAVMMKQCRPVYQLTSLNWFSPNWFSQKESINPEIALCTNIRCRNVWETFYTQQSVIENSKKEKKLVVWEIG